MMEGIGNRVKGRSKERLHEVNKRKKMETSLIPPVNKRRRRQREENEEHDSDVEDITPIYNNKSLSSQESGNSLRFGSQGNVSVKEHDLGPSSSKLRDGSAQSSCLKEKPVPSSYVYKQKSSETVVLAAERSLHAVIEISSDSESEEEEEETQDKDDMMVDSLSSDDEYNLKEVVGDTNCDELRKAKVSTVGRNHLGRPKKSVSPLTKPRKIEDKKIREEEEEKERRQKEAETEPKQPSNVVFICCHCGKENTRIPESRSSGIRPQVLRDEVEDMNNVASTSVSKHDDFVSVNVEKSPELENSETGKEVPVKISKPVIQSSVKAKEVQAPVKTSRLEVQSFDKAKQNQTNLKIPEVAKGLNMSDVAKEQNDDESGSSLAPVKTSRLEDKSFDKAKQDQTNLKIPEVAKGLNMSDVAEEQNYEESGSSLAPVKTSRLEVQSFDKAKQDQTNLKMPEVARGLNTSDVAKEQIDDESGSSLAPVKTSRLEDKSFDKAKQDQTNLKIPEVAVGLNTSDRAKEQIDDESGSSLASVKTSRLEDKSFDKAKQDQTNLKIPEVAEGLNMSDVANEQIEDESDPSLSSSDESGTSLKDKEEVKASDNSESKMINGNSKEDLLRLLINCDGDKGEEAELVSSPEDQSQEQVAEDMRIFDDEGLFIIRPPPLNLRFGVHEPPPPVMTEEEREQEELWEQLAFCLKSNEDSNELLSNIDQEMLVDESAAARCRNGDHELEIDMEIGMKCKHCSFVETEIRYMDTSEWAEKLVRGRRKINRYDEEENSSFVGNFGFEAFNKNISNEGCASSVGTVWEKIPGVKSQMYPHQQEGFEFIWKNLAGTIMLNELKDYENSDETGGCIMSHAPGTGKTRLTIIFLQAYLECFPNCRPVIIAPASLLLTWAEEFRKWNISIPFHNLSSLEFSGKESSVAMETLMQKNLSDRNYTEIRKVKLYSWIQSRSILGISYQLYEKLAGVRKEDKKTKKELEIIRDILIRVPGLLVLDEAHTPRNERSRIWKTLSKVDTQKRILLSGTPFQNNFKELCNVLELARPKYTERLKDTLKKSGMTKQRRGKRHLGDGINQRGIEELKTVMFPFVHVHKGSILQKSLPGLRECVVVLNPPELQKRVLESIEVTYNSKTINVFETEHKLSLVSVHPSLVSLCKLSERERLSIDDALLAKLKEKRDDPNQSVKTRFLMEFIAYCEIKKEKVLVFSQYIDPLELIMEHLEKRFKWNKGEEVLYMHGKLEQKQRQFLINEFNDPRSKAKVLLASTKACSEGINLVGASRVILLDVVWNPAVERQAISRAYRIGQKRIVYTYHLVAKGTPEGPKYCKQAQKDRISELVFACSSKHEKAKEKIAEVVTEDQILDTLVKHSKLGDMFDNLIVQPKEADLVEGFNILMP